MYVWRISTQRCTDERMRFKIQTTFTQLNSNLIPNGRQNSAPCNDSRPTYTWK